MSSVHHAGSTFNINKYQISIRHSKNRSLTKLREIHCHYGTVTIKTIIIINYQHLHYKIKLRLHAKD